jgi:hypothetical protein
LCPVHELISPQDFNLATIHRFCGSLEILAGEN